ncbi:hypothetical protein EDD22DRAFT_881798 [Suillus occidentalis]|nr:hypothetical protein EDD22DRAFT_881798 [Suillus occidentalis]
MINIRISCLSTAALILLPVSFASSSRILICLVPPPIIDLTLVFRRSVKSRLTVRSQLSLDPTLLSPIDSPMCIIITTMSCPYHVVLRLDHALPTTCFLHSATSASRPCCVKHSTCHINAASNIAHAVLVPRHRRKNASSHLLCVVRNLRVSTSAVKVAKVDLNVAS